MKRCTRILLVFSCVALALAPLQAQAQIDCKAYENYAGAEPPGYAEQCLGRPAIGGTGSVATPRDPTDTGFKYDMRNNVGLYSYQVGSFPTQTFIGNPFPGNVGFAWDFDSTGTTLWAHNFTTNQFGTVNTTTAAFTPVSSVVLPGGQTFTGLTIDPVNDIFYASGTDGVTSTLYTLNPNTGMTTTIGNMGIALCIEIAMNCAGQLFAHDIGTDSLYSVNPATGAATLVGPHGLAANFAQGMDFDNSDGTLYGCIYTGGGTNTYAAWNTTNGSITPLNVNSPLGEWECMIPTTCAQPDLTIGKTVDPTGPVISGDVLTYTITVNNIGNAAATNVIVIDVIPTNTTYVANSCTTTLGTCGLNGNQVEFNLGILNAAASATMTFQVMVDPAPLPPGVISNNNYTVDSDQTQAVAGPPVENILVPAELLEFDAAGDSD